MSPFLPPFPSLSRALFAASTLALAALLAGCRPAGERADGVELVPSSAPLHAASTFEVRFAEPMVAAAEVGRANALPPIEVRPRLNGSWLWTSARGGVFTPGEPLALGTRYTFTLRSGLRNATGQTSPARLQRVVTTPGFALVEVADAPRGDDCPATPRLRLLFNAAVAAEEVAPFLGFVSAQGTRIAVEANPATMADRRWGFRVGGRERMAWDEWFAASRAPATESSEDALTNPAPNLLLVSPREPLAPGTSWALVAQAGLPMAGGRATLGGERRIELGVVRPFALAEVNAHNTVGDGRSLRLSFTKRPEPTLATNFADFITVSPPVSNLTASVWGPRMALRGDFDLQRPYTVRVRAGLPSADGLRLDDGWEGTLAVPPIAPRLMFPAVEAGQFAAGRREFPLLVMNVDHVRVRAKRLDDASLIHGLRGFGRAYRGSDRLWDDDFTAVNYELIPGRTLYDETFAGTTEADRAFTLPLDWDRILGAGGKGAVFLCAERVGGRATLRLPPALSMPAPTRLGVEAMVQVTDLGLVWKTSADELLAFVFSLESGAPLPDAEVGLLTDEGEVLATATTSAEGLVRLPLDGEAVWLLARTEDGDALAVEWRQGLTPMWAFDLPRAWGWDGAQPERSAVLFSDRDLYRPGETLHLKGVVREWRGDHLGLPTTNQGTLTVRDYRNSVALSTNLTLSPDGTFALDVPLPREARQGRYDISARFGGADAWLGVQVIEFRPRAFEIQLAARPHYAADEPVAVPVSARYLFGRALDQARLNWTLRFEDRPAGSPHFADFQFARAWRESALGQQGASGTLTGEAVLGGTNQVELPAEPGFNASAPQPRHAALTVEVTDQNQQTLSQSAAFVRHSSDFYLGLKLDREVLEAGTPLEARAVAIATDGAPWSNAVPATLRLRRIEWQTVRLLGAGGAATYRSEATVTNLLTRDFTLPAANWSRDHAGRWLPGAAPLPPLTPDLPGEYLLELSATDAAGRLVVCSESFHVSAPGRRLAWNYRNAVHIELLPDRETYAPGDTATLLLKTPLSGTALVTVERAEVRREFVTRVEGNAPVVRVPLLPGDAPNVAVVVALLRGARESSAAAPEPEYRLGAVNLTVVEPSARLEVSLALNGTNHLPGARVEAGVLVRDHEGRPVPNAEVTLYAVDEGVLGMSDYQLPDLLAAFYAPRPVRVDTGLSLPLLLPEDDAHRRFGNKGYVLGDGKEGLGRVRQNFALCAFWNAALRTDAEGRIAADFIAPDSLTRFRLLAVALRAPGQFGGAETSFSVSKPLVLEPALPPIARRTDELLARAVVLNQTDTAGEVEVSLELDGTATAKASAALTRRWRLAPRGAAVMEVPLTFIATGEARWTWRARFTDPAAPAFTDAVESRMDVLPPAPRLTERRSFSVSGPTNLLAGFNPQMFHGEGEVVVTLASSRLVGLAEAIPHLLHYPYGCAEQTGSSLLPWLLVRDTPALAPLVATSGQDAEDAIQRGVRRLLDLRTVGGVGYWPGAREPMPWATAYATLVLAVARNTGVEVPPEALEQLGRQLAEGLPSALTNRESIATACLALYALGVAGDARPAWHEKFFEQRGRLSGEARALLALAIHRVDGPEAMIAELLAQPASADAAPLEFASPRREQALRLLAWVNLQPDAPTIGPLVDGLMARLTGGGQGSTQDNAWSLLALCAYANACEGEPAPVSGVARFAETATSFALDAERPLTRLRFARPAGETRDTLALEVTPGTKLFARVEAGVTPPGREQAARDQGFSVSRVYARLNDLNEPAAPADLRVGDRVLVTLRVALPERAEFLALDDALPAVLEAVLPDFRGGPAVGDAHWDGFSDFRELRGDRALFFANEAPAGVHEIRYLARVRAAGVATAPACKLEAMYRPDRYGLSASQVLEARP